MEVPRNELKLRDNPELLSTPTLVQPLYGCAKDVNVIGYVTDATLDLELNGAIAVAGFPGHSPFPSGALIKLPNPLVPGDKLRARQHRAAATSSWTPIAVAQDHTKDFPAGLPRPELFQTPLYNCGVRTGVNNLLVGCDVQVTANGTQVGSASGANNPQGIGISPQFATGQHVRTIARLCNDPSPPSQEQIVQVPPLPLTAPTYDPTYAGGTVLVVGNIADGAHFTLSRNGTLVGTFACWGGRCNVNLSPPLTANETFSAIQELCPGDGPSAPGTTVVQPCSALPAPQIGPIQDGDTQITVTQFVAGSEIKVYVNSTQVGDGSGPLVNLSAPIPHGATVDVWQILGTCQGATVQQVTAQCIAPPVSGDPSALDLFPVGTHDYDGGTVSIQGGTLHVRGSIFYPAEDDGTDQPFNKRLAKLGRVPLVVCVHGNHDPSVPSFRGYDYFQTALARAGFIAVSVDENETNGNTGGAQNITLRSDLTIATIAFLQQIDAGGPIFEGTMEFARTGLMGHSRGAECVIGVTERITLPGVTIPAVLSLAPVNNRATSGKPHGYAFMTFLPAADGDVVDNNGAQFYDQAIPGPRKIQLYIDHANHNFFNRQWLNDDAQGILPIMARPDHERILLTYGCAFFRAILRGDATAGYLEDTILPAGVQNQNIHLAFASTGARVVDDYDGHPITQDTEGQPTTQSGGLTAQDFRFAQAGALAFNASFFGDTEGNVANAKEATGDFREPLKTATDLTAAEVHVRAAEVFQAPNIPATATGFRVGVEDIRGNIAWVNVDDVGGLPRPFDRRAFDAKTKTMLSTFRFPGRCFAAASRTLQIKSIRAIHLGLNRGDERPIAFDDLHIMHV
jgi:hypothetical protein